MRRIPQVLLASALMIIAGFFLRFGTPSAFSLPAGRTVMDGGALGELEAFVEKQVPFSTALTELGLSVRVFGGQREYNQIFISTGGGELIPDIDPPIGVYVQENTAAILEFADRVGVPTYCMIIPTVSAIRQQSLPQFGQAQTFNQKQFIEEAYSRMTGRVTVVDVYPVLFNAREQYLYYRTEDNLTALGGYYLYTVLGNRLLEGMSPPGLSDFDIEYVGGGYYGSLYERSPFKDARADALSIFHYTRNAREYMVLKREDGRYKTYHTLYPRHMEALGRPMDIYFGGVSAMTTITSTSPYSNKLLVFGDKTAVSYLPFLVGHYQTVTLVNFFQMDAAGYGDIALEDYDQVLFAYGIESYMHNNYLTRALRLFAQHAE